MRHPGRRLDVTNNLLSFGLTDQSLLDGEVVLTSQVTQLNGIVTDDRRRDDHDRLLDRSRPLAHRVAVLPEITVAGQDGMFDSLV